MKLYLSGPMTGIAEHNFPAFQQAAEALRDKGYEVLSPAERFDGRTDLPRTVYLRADINDVLAADGVAVLAGWQKSQGASLEVEVARAIDTPVYCFWCLEVGRSQEVARTCSTATCAPLARSLSQPGTESLAPIEREEGDRAQEDGAAPSILDEASTLVNGDRRRDYDHPLPNFRRAGTLWGTLLEKYVREAQPGDPVPPRLVAHCMIAMKLSRDVFTPKRDNLVDIAGYAHCAQEILDRQTAQPSPSVVVQ